MWTIHLTVLYSISSPSQVFATGIHAYDQSLCKWCLHSFFPIILQRNPLIKKLLVTIPQYIYEFNIAYLDLYHAKYCAIYYITFKQNTNVTLIFFIQVIRHVPSSGPWWISTLWAFIHWCMSCCHMLCYFKL